MSRRAKILIIVDVTVLAAFVVTGVVYLLLRDTDGTSSTLATPPGPPTTPHVTSAFVDWGPDVCPNFQFFDHLADSQLPGAVKNQLCWHDPNTPIAIGTYDDQSKLDNDVARLGGTHRYATGTDDSARIWVFVVLQRDESALGPLKKYGFTLH
jgi:hypothetical protein